MPKLSDVQIAALIVDVWGKPWTSTISDGVAIVLAESGGNPAAINRANSNGTSDHGLWQINSIHASKFRMVPAGHRSGSLWDNRYDPVSNTKMAHQIYRGWGSSWRPWSAYNNGSYRKYRERGRIAASKVQGTDKKSMVDSIVGALKRGMFAGLDPTGLDQSDRIKDQFSEIAAFLKFISDKENWVRLGFILAGSALILFAVYQILLTTDAGKFVKKTVKTGAKLAVTKGKA